jgi:hypothetical protein
MTSFPLGFDTLLPMEKAAQKEIDVDLKGQKLRVVLKCSDSGKLKYEVFDVRGKMRAESNWCDNITQLNGTWKSFFLDAFDTIFI